MKHLKIILVAAMALILAGCVLNGKPKLAPAATTPTAPVTQPAPPEPLSVPQPRPDFPEAQPFDSASLKTLPPEPQIVVTLPQGPQSPPGAAPQRQAPAPKPVETPAAPPAPEPTRPLIQEILSPEEQRDLARRAQSRRSETMGMVGQLEHRPLSANQRGTLRSINQFVSQSEQAEKNNDMRGAAEFADKAYIMAKELQGGK